MYPKTNFFNNTTGNSPFGQTSFQKPVQSGFGQTTAFGQQNNSFFGGTQNTQSGFATGATNTFGTSTQPQQSFGGFAQPQQTSLFGSTQQNTNQSLIFGQAPTSAFGAPAKTSGFGFNQNQPSTSLFGQTNTTANTGFGSFAANTSNNVFGSNTSTFGQSSLTNTNVNNGTGSAKYQPLIGTDTIVKSGQQNNVNTKLHCITAMKEYESKSLEELRLEDYAANRKGTTGSVFGTQPTNTGGIFGNNTQQTTGLFGNQNEKSLFGATNPLTNSTFGTATNNNAFGQTNQQTSGFFGKPFATPTSTTNTFGGFGTTDQSAFGAKPFNQPNQTGLFGQPATPAVSSFNQTNAFSGFGAANPQPSLFGNATADNKGFGLATATSNTGFTGFGGLNATNNTSGNLFGKTTSAFGTNTGFTAPVSSTSGFGISNFGTASNSNSIFNNSMSKPATSNFTGFMAQNTAAPLGGNLSFNSGNQNLFGTNKTGSLFGNNNQQNNSLFGTTTNFGNVGTLGTFSNNTLNLGGQTGSVALAQQTEVPIHQQILSIATTPYGENQIFKDIKLSKSLDTTDAIRSTNPAAQKAILESGANFKVANKQGGGLKVKPIGNSLTKKALFDGLEEYDSSLEESFSFKKNAKRLIIKSKYAAEKTDQSDKTPDAASPGIIKKKLVINRNQSVNLTDEIDSARRRESWLTPNTIEKFHDDSLQINSSFDNTLNELITTGNKKQNLSIDKNISQNTPNLSTEEFQSQEESEVIVNENVDSNNVKTYSTGIILNRAGYYTVPALEELSSYVTSDGKCIVPNFTIGREGYGNAYFSNSVDITGINFDEIVHFRHKEITIYPGEQNKPAIGQGLNREAQVTLDQVWPHDKTLHEPIKDVARLEEMNYEATLRRACDKYDFRFIEYRPETGSWVFKVKHFSKYGLSDSDEEILTAAKPKEIKVPALQPQFPVAKVPIKLPVREDIRTKKDSTIPLKQVETNEINEVSFVSQASALAKERGTDSHKLQLMKSSFFVYDDSEILTSPADDFMLCEDSDQIVPGMFGSQTIPKEGSVLSLTKDSHFQYDIDTSESQSKQMTSTHESVMETETIEPIKRVQMILKPTVSAKNIYNKSTLEADIINSNQTKCISDLSMLNFKRFKVNFGPNNSLLIPSFSGSIKKDKNNFLLDEISNVSNVLNHYSVITVLDEFEASFVPHLELQLRNSIRIEMKNSNCSSFMFGGGIPMISQHLSIAQQCQNEHSIKNDTSVLSLCEALWSCKEDMDTQDSSSHLLIMHRKNVLSEWLERILINNKEFGDRGHHAGNELFYNIYCQKIDEACNMLLENNEPYLALMLSQISGGPAVRQLIQHQLQEWQKVRADEYINSDKLELLMLISGTQLMSSVNEPLNVLKDLHWLKVFAIQLWYLCSATSSVTDAVFAFENLFKNENCELLPPYPDYFVNANDHDQNDQIYDIKYHILQIFSKRSYSIETLINPLTHTPNILDFRLSWIMFSVLKAIGYNHCSKLCEMKLYTDIANQLENEGIWHWSIFILLHIDDVDKRELCVQQVLYRNVSIKKNEDINKEEKFVINTLGIPQRWIYWAKAVKAGVFNQHFKQAKYLLKAKKLWEAHNVIVSHIAPAAIVNDKLEFLESMVGQLEELKLKKPYNTTTWTNQGQILIDFLEINRRFNILKESNEANVEDMWENLKPLLVDLCGRINMFACPTPKHRLCQSEMAQKLGCCSRGFFLNTDNKNPCFLIKIALEKLPLPQEFAQQELRVLLEALINDVFK